MNTSGIHPDLAFNSPAVSAARSRRVLVLLAAVVLMSFADLYMTLLHMTSFGMLEVNPIARAIMQYNDPRLLILWKVVTVALGVGILAYFRRLWHGEVGAWVCTMLLAALMAQWAYYGAHVSSFTREMSIIAAGGGDVRWVSIAAAAE